MVAQARHPAFPVAALPMLAAAVAAAVQMPRLEQAALAVVAMVAHRQMLRAAQELQIRAAEAVVAEMTR